MRFASALIWIAPGTVAHAATLRVPDAHPTIQSALAAAADDDTILVAPGFYDENLDTSGKRLFLLSEQGAEQTIVDGGFRGPVLKMTGGGAAAGFTFQRGQSQFEGGGIFLSSPKPTEIRDNVIRDNIAGFSVDQGLGGGIQVELGTQDIRLVNNSILANYAGDEGGGIFCSATGGQILIEQNTIQGNACHVCGAGISIRQGIVRGNLIVDNWADSFGAGVCVQTTGLIEGNTIVRNFNDNSFVHGAGIQISSGSPTVRNNIVALNGGRNASGGGIRCFSGTPVVECNDSWGNENLDYIGAECIQPGSGNISLDPLFCDEANDNFHLRSDSPCSAQLQPFCGRMGAFPIGCGPTPSEATTWGRIKAGYR